MNNQNNTIEQGPSQFKLLGIYVDDLEIVEEINDKIKNYQYFNYQKVLEKGYFAFDNTYIFKEENGNITFTKSGQIDIYDINENLKISVNAIVGKNGSGKSTILEILMLMIYNLSIKKKVLHPTFPTKERASSNYRPYLKSSLYYLSNNIIRQLKFNITEDSIEHSINKISYSIYKDELFELIETNLWTDEIEESNIKNELYFNLNEFFYGIALNYSVFGLDNNKIGDWIQQLFHKNDGYQTPLVMNPYREDGNYFINKEIQLSIDRIITNIYSEDTPNLQISNDYKAEKVVFENLSEKQKIKINSILLPFFKYNDLEKTDEEERNEKKTESEDSLILELEQNNYSPNVTPLYFLENIRDLSDYTFDISKKDYLTYTDFFSYAISISENQKSIYDLFNKLGVNIFDFSQKNKQIINQIISYIIYKLYKTAYTYPEVFSGIIDYRTNILNEEYIFKKVFLDKSHITLKLRRAVLFLLSSEDIIKDVEFSGFGTVGKSNNYEKSDYILEIFTADKLLKYYAKIKKGKRKSVNEIVYTDSLTLIPPPIYDVQFSLKNIHTKKEVSISDLSSGELQMMLSIHCVLYHLKNINSVQLSDNIIKYNNVVVLLDEIELYFHPDYQRLYIDALLKLIERNQSNLKEINSIQFIFSTHSPFILSDIPSQNILKLKNGIPQPNDEKSNSFAANIHDLLNDDFFLKDGTMGEFARNKIKDILEKKVIEVDDLKIIDLIGDPFLKGVVLSKIKENMSIEAIDKEIERLNNLKINKRNDATNR